MDLSWSKLLLLGCLMIWIRRISGSTQTTNSTQTLLKTTSSLRAVSAITTPEQTLNETQTPTKGMAADMSTTKNVITEPNVTTTRSVTGETSAHIAETSTSSGEAKEASVETTTSSGETKEATIETSTSSGVTNEATIKTNEGSGETNEATYSTSTISATTETNTTHEDSADYEYYEDLPFPDGWCAIDQRGHELHPVYCNSDQYCCGKISRRKCCPKLASGAIFGIVSSVLVISTFALCCVVGSCLWCDVCPYRKARLRKKMNINPPMYTPPGDRQTQYTVKDETLTCLPDSNTFRPNDSIPDGVAQDDKGENVADDGTDTDDIEAKEKETEVNLLADTQL